MIRPALILSALLSTVAAAQVSGQLGSGTTTWAGNISLVGDVTVPPDGTLVIQPGTVITAAATDSQGGGDISTKPEIIVQGTLNVSGVNGGGVTFTGSSAVNTAWGGIVLRAGASASISYATMDGMQGGITATVGGAGVTTTLTVSNTSVSNSLNCVRTTSGAGTGTFNITNTTLSNCVSAALEHRSGTLAFNDSVITGTTGANAVYQTGGVFSALRSRFTNNAYGLYVAGGTNTVLDRCTIAFNGNASTGSHGLETSVSSGTVSVTSSIISQNYGYGVRRSSSGTLNLTYSDVWGNSNTAGPAPTAGANTNGSNVFNLVQSVAIGNSSNNKSENPLFVDTATRNFRITSNSPARFSGLAGVDMGALAFGSDLTVGLQGTLWNDTSLSGANSVIGDLTVPATVTLTLNPGATLTFAATDLVGGGVSAVRSEILVYGTLTGIGTAGSGVSLTGAGTGNSAWGGITVRAGGSATLSNLTLDESTDGLVLEVGGSGVSTTLTMSNASLSNSLNCVRTTSGAGTGTFNITNTTLSNCVSAALEHRSGNLAFNGSAITGTTGANAVYQTGGVFSALSSRFTNNAYGLYVAGGTNTVLDRCTIAFNGNASTGSHGLETSVSSGTVSITSSIISQNYGYGVRRSSSGTLNLTYSDVWGNSNTSGPAPTAGANTNGSNVFNLVQSVAIGNSSNNKSENPLFVDTATRNYRLTSNSPARFSGSVGVDMGALPFTSDLTVGLQGTLWNDTSLSGANSVIGDLTVPATVTLTLNPGATLTFAATDLVGGGVSAVRSEILVYGTLSAIGVSGTPIALTGAGSGNSAWGGITVRAGGSASIANVTMDESTDGVVLEVGGSGVTTAMTMSNTTLSNSLNCVRTTSGAGTGTFSINSSTFSNCVSAALEHRSGALTVVASAVTGTTGANAVYQTGGTLSLERTLISNNAYGAYIAGGTSSSFDRCTIAYNGNASTGSHGLETSVSSGTVTIISSIISHNYGYGVRRSSSGTLNLTYSNVWGNSNTSGPPPTAGANTNGSNIFNLVQSVAIGNSSNNKSENPLFVDGPARNYGLQVTSPSRAAGSAGVDQGAFPFTVGAVASVTVSPATATLSAGGITGFAAQARDAMGNIVSNEPITWSVVTPAAGTITAGGVLTAGCAPGTYTASVSARTANGTIGTASVVINLGAPSQIVISPSGASVKSQATQQYTASVKDSCNNTLTGQTITWGANASAGNINGSGLFSASCQRGTYPAGITASAGSLTANTTVDVIAGDPAAISVTPMTVSVPAGTTQQFAASIADGCGNTVSGGVTWSTTVTGATINSTGLLTAGQTSGTFATGVTATAGARTASASVTITGGSGGTVASVTVAPLTVSLLPGATQTFVATARDSGNVVLTGLPVTWSVASGGGTIGSSSGVFTAGNTAGTFTDTVVATVGGVTGRASVTVQPGAVATVTVAPTTVTLAPGGQASFTATGRDAFNNVVSSPVTWTASAAVGTITSGGVLTATMSPGNYPASVTATMGSVSGTAGVTVQTGALSQLVIAPAATSLQAGAVAAFAASGRDALGNTVAVTPVWTVVAGGGTINVSGVFTAGTAAGTFANTIRAEANGLTAFASVSITPGPVLSVAVTPMTASVQTGGSLQFTAEARDAFNNVVPTGFTWTAQTAVGVINQGGFFTAGSSPGSYPNSISAAVGSITGFASLSITGTQMMDGGMGGGAGGGSGGGGGSMNDAGMGGGGGSMDMDAGLGGGAGGGSGTGGGSATGGGTASGGGMGTGGGEATGGGGGGMTTPSGCSCNTVDPSFLVFGLLLLARRRS